MERQIFQTNFTFLDWGIVFVYLALTLVIGVIANRYIARFSDYLVAGRHIRLHLLIATMVGTELGLVTVMYNAQEGFERGLSAFHIGLVQLLCYLFVGLTGFIVYRLRAEGVMTIPEFYGKRFGPRVQWCGAVILCISGILNFGLFAKASAQFLAGVLGWGPTAVNWLMTVMALFVMFYTILGGMVSVVLTDYLQFVCLSAGIGIGTFYAINAVGWQEIFTVVAAERGAAAVNPLMHQDYGLAYIVWMVLLNLSAACLWMPSVARSLSAKSPEVAKKVYAWSSVGFLMRCVLPMVWGVCAFVFVTKNPQLRHAFFEAPEGQRIEGVMAMPMFLAQVMPTGLLGLLSAGMVAAYMSTQDSYLLSWASVITQDVIAPLSKRPLSDAERILITRIAIAAIGAFLIFWGLWYPLSATLWTYMAATGTVYLSGAFSVMVAGLYWKRASSTGALLALGAGLFALVSIIPEKTLFGRDVAWFSEKNVAVAAWVLSALLMAVGSWLFPDRRRH